MADKENWNQLDQTPIIKLDEPKFLKSTFVISSITCIGFGLARYFDWEQHQIQVWKICDLL